MNKIEIRRAVVAAIMARKQVQVIRNASGPCPDYRNSVGQPLDLCAVFGRSGR